MDARGRQVLSFTQNNSLNIANDGEPTRTTQHSETVIDLTIVSPTLEPELEWKIFNSPLDSDHNPIIISVKRSFRNDSTSIRTNIKRANWEVYRNSVAWKDLPPRVDLVDDKEIMRDLYARFEQASNDAIPMIQIGHFFPKPWWSAECLVTLKKRERLYRIFRNTKSPRNMINWKKARAEHRQVVRRSKRKNWQQYISEISSDTPIKKVWEKIRNIKGHAPRKLTILKCNNITYTTETEIADKIAETFSNISSTNNYSRNFRRRKFLEELEVLSYDDGDSIYYSDFREHELNAAIHRLKKNTAPGLYKIHNQIIIELPENCKKYLLKVYNLWWQSHYFPECWRKSIVVPIPKPDKEHSSPSNYLPISLTSVLCKTMERIVIVVITFTGEIDTLPT